VVSLEQDKARMNERIAALSKQLETLDKEKRPSVDSLKAFIDAKNENALLHDQVKMLADTVADKDKRLENMSGDVSQKSKRIDELLKEKASNDEKYELLRAQFQKLSSGTGADQVFIVKEVEEKENRLILQGTDALNLPRERILDIISALRKAGKNPSLESVVNRFFDQ